LNWKIALIKEKNQKNEDQIIKNKTTKNLIEWLNWKKNSTKVSRTKLKIKKKGTEMKNQRYEKLQLKD